MSTIDCMVEKIRNIKIRITASKLWKLSAVNFLKSQHLINCCFLSDPLIDCINFSIAFLIAAYKHLKFTKS